MKKKTKQKKKKQKKKKKKKKKKNNKKKKKKGNKKGDDCTYFGVKCLTCLLFLGVLFIGGKDTSIFEGATISI